MEQQSLQKLVNDGLSSYQIAEAMSYSQTTIRYWLKKYGLKTNYKRRTSKIWQVSHKDLSDIVGRNLTFAEILRQIGYDHNLSRALYNALKNRMDQEDIDYSHIKIGRGNFNGRRPQKMTEEKLMEILSRDETLKGGHAKKYIMRFNLIPHENCQECGQGRVWNGKKLSLHLDHIDGNPRNNKLKNLRFLCPNCHAQTPTYCNGNVKR